MDRTPVASTPAGAQIGLVAAQVVVPCDDVAETLAFFTDRLGFLVELVSPADDPAVVVVSGLGVRLRLVRSSALNDRPPSLVLACADPDAFGAGRRLVAPNGSAIELVPADPPLHVPELQPSFVLNRLGAGGFHEGRAGMGYRDLIPDRQGGRFIASHIRIADAGPVPDYVHFHQVRFQMIFCANGWVRLVYEDQGDPFVLAAGDCVLQPPLIRHRVLESSAGLEVVEIGCPAIHDTHADPTTSLPTGRLLPGRPYGDDTTGRQRYVHHVAATARWMPHRFAGFEHRDTGIADATDGLAGARVLRRAARGATAAGPSELAHDGELWFGFVIDGSVGLDADVDGGRAQRLGRGDAVVVPPGVRFALLAPTEDLQLLEVTLPA